MKTAPEPYLVESSSGSSSFASNVDLEEQIRRNPDDVSRRLVYADWLSTKGDPRGELASVQNALNAKTEDQALRERMEQILTANGGFRGGISAQVMSVEWNLGLFRMLRLMNFIDWMDSKFDARAVARRAFDLPCATCLDELRIGLLRWEYQADDLKTTLEEASKSAFGKSLRRLKIGDVHDIDIDNAHHQLGSVDGVNEFRSLESIFVWGSDIALTRPLDLPELRSLAIQTCGLSGDAFNVLIKSTLPKIEKLDLWFGSEDYGASVSADQLAPLLDGVTFPGIKELGICNSEFINDVPELLLASKVLPKLEVLDLKKGVLSDNGIQVLLEHPEAWKHLKQLNVSQSYLSAETIEALQKVGPTIDASAQNEDDDDDAEEGEEPYRYVSMRE